MKRVLKKGKLWFFCLIMIIFISIIWLFFSYHKQINVVKHIPDYSSVKVVGDYLDNADLIKAPYILEGTVRLNMKAFPLLKSHFI